MTLTAKTMEWLDQNRRRAYPMRRDEWRKIVSPESGLDGVLLDALAFCADARGDETLSLESVAVSDVSSVVEMRYAGKAFAVTLTGGESSGDRSYAMFRVSVDIGRRRDATISLAFSSHAYLLSTLGVGSWSIGCEALGSRVIGLSDGFGVDGIAVHGSSCVEGHEGDAVASGHVVLEDGFRTSPVIQGGRVVVRVGRRYGLDPCHHACGEESMADCRVPLFFFCGQNGVNSGDVVLRGGRGVSVEQGRRYVVKTGSQAGKSVPCVEIVAGSELLGMYRPGDV